MPRHCTACTHPDRQAIDRQLVSGTALRNVPEQFRLRLLPLTVTPTPMAVPPVPEEMQPIGGFDGLTGKRPPWPTSTRRRNP